MNAHLIGTWPVGSPDWHAARKPALGGSEIAAVIGLSPWESPFSLWHRKKGLVGPQAVNDAMEAGTRLEPVICQKFADDHPEMLVSTSGTWQNDDRAWQLANPDRVIGRHIPNEVHVQALLEAKFALYPDGWGEPGTEEIPVFYRAQTLWYLDVFGLDICYLEVFIGSCAEFREYVIHADPDEQQWLREQAAEFLRTIDAGERPDIDTHSATYDVVRELHPDITDDKVEAPDDLALAYLAALDACDTADAEKRLQTARMADLLGSGRKVTYQGRDLCRRQAKNGGTPYIQAISRKTNPTTNVKKAAAA